MHRETNYSWISIPVDPKHEPVTGHADDGDFFQLRRTCEALLGSDLFIGETRIAAIHILDAYGRVVWTGFPDA